MSWNQELFKQTLDFAARAHGDQKTKTGVPYVVHLVKVATEVLCAADGSFDVDFAMQCALLHDCMEDAGVSHQALAQAFGARVADGVRALSKDDAVGRGNRMDDVLRRIRTQPREVWLVKLADRITNLEPPPPQWDDAKVAEYREEAGRIYEALHGCHAGLAARLQQKIAAYGV